MKIIVYKNGVQVGSLSIDDQSLLTTTGDLPESVESSIVVGVLLESVAFGSMSLGVDKYTWNEEMPINPTAKLPMFWWERLQKQFSNRN